MPAAPADRRLLVFIAVSLLVHLGLVARWGFDSGRRPAQAPATITARIEPAAVDPAPEPQPEPVLTVPAPDPTGALPEAPPAAPVRPPAAEPPQPGPPQPPEPGRSRPEAPHPPDLPAAVAPVPDTERPGAADLTWYTGRDLDILPRPLDPIEPAFPINAQLRGVSGKVTLAVSIDAAGRVVDVEVVRAEPPGFFEASAVAAFRAARYAPGIKDGRAVRARLQTVVVFELGPR